MRIDRRPTLFAVLAAALCLVAAPALGGCAEDDGDETLYEWASRLDELDGVEKAEVLDDAEAPWAQPSKGLVGKVEVDPTLTEAQAEAIAEQSCEPEAEYFAGTRVGVQGSEPWTAAAYGDSTGCFDKAQLVLLSRALEAADDVSFDGEVVVRSGTEAPGLSARTEDPDLLLDYLDKAHRIVDDTSLIFSGVITDIPLTPGTGDSDADPLLAELLPETKIASALPLVRSALDLDHREIRLTDAGVTVQAASTTALAESSFADLPKRARRAGVRLSVSLPPIPGSDDPKRDAALIEALRARAGADRVVFPDAGSLYVSVPLEDPDDIETGIRLVAELAPRGAPFEFAVPDSDGVKVDVEASARTADALTAVYREAVSLHDERTRIRMLLSSANRYGGGERLIIQLEEGATEDQLPEIRDRLRPLLDDDYAEVVFSVGGRNIDFGSPS